MSQKTFANHLADEEAALAQKASASQTQAQPRRASTVEGGSSVQQTSDIDDDPCEADPLLRTHVPPLPDEMTIEEMLRQPPLSWNEAGRVLADPNKPRRHFCEMCGYWGLIKCMKCGARVCGLECKTTHDETRCLKFYV